MKIFLLLVGLTISFNASSEDDKPEGLFGDPYYDYMVTCASSRITMVLKCIDWVMMNLNKDNGIVFHGVLTMNGGQGFDYHQSFRLENNLKYRKEGKSREEIKSLVKNK